ncbi:L-lactate permease [Staphylococcus massiliensis]|uniref:L-lactate permease n=1 Tax=Staphylococcus massiliensis TaxID=555791 RepID=UPI001EDF61C4|nr:L-lactate permease [Staphylococcus massiliensis]MCG3399303.1 L-lactate permease [Staphylococcus massiliensis]
MIHLILALLPLVIVLACLLILKFSALKTGIITFTILAILVLINTPYQITFYKVVESSVNGILISSIAAYVIFFGVLLFHLMNESGKIQDISTQIKLLTNDQVLQVIILVVCISPLIESTSGFGTAFLVITPILMSLEINHYKAACIGILSLLAVPWGALATGTVIGTEIVNLDLKHVGFLTSILTVPSILYFLGLCIYILGGSTLLKNNIYKILIYTLIFSLSNIFFNFFISVELAGVLSSLLTLVIGITHINIQNGRTNKSFNALIKLLSPYIFLTILVLISRTIPIFETFLKNHFVISIEKFNFRLLLLHSPGFWLIITCIYTIIKFKINAHIIFKSLHKTLNQWGIFVISTTLFISMAEIMDTSGMITTISNGINNNVGKYFIVISGIIGSVGGFLTGSNTGANAMFMKLQIHTARELNLSTSLIAGLQNASASNSTMSTPSRILLAANLCDIKEHESKLQREFIKITAFSTLTLIVVSFLIITFI